MVEPSVWWRPDIHADRRPFLLARGRIQAAFRQWFADEGFLEVETGILQVSPGNETHLHAFATSLVDGAGQDAARYLRTSPEFACKKLLAAGETRIFEFARSFRNREQGPQHHPEYTMLEWYRTGAPYEALMADCAALLAAAARAAEAKRLTFRGQEVDPQAEPVRMTVAEAFARHAGIELLATLSPEAGDRDRFAAMARSNGYRIAEDDDWGDIFSRILVESIEPQLGGTRATILMEYPAILSALARPKPSDPRVAERFELFACGVELANGFGELTDPHVQQARLVAQMDEKERRYGERYPIDADFIAALSAMPAASGIALGFDRLVMLATGASRIEQVLWAPVARP